MNVRLLKNRAPWQNVVTAFFTGQAASILGSGLVQFALIWYVTFRTNSGRSMMAVTLASFIPQLIVALFSGVWADRYDRRKIIILADGGIALATLAVALLFLYGYDHIWLIYIVSAVRSLGGGIQGPAITALIPQVVPKESLVRVNGIYNTINNVVQLLSPILGGAMIVIMPMWSVFMIDVVTAAIAITIMFFLPIPDQKTGKVTNLFGKSPKPDDFDWKFPPIGMEGAEGPSQDERGADDPTPNSLKEFKEGLAYMKTKPFIARLMSLYAGFMVLLAPVAILLPLYIRRHFGTEVWYVTAAQTALFAGMAVGGFAVSIKGEFRSRIGTIRGSGLSMSLLTLALAALGFARTPLFFTFAVIALGFGFIVPFYTTAVTVLLQENVERAFHGRVFALLYMTGSAAIPLGTAIFGPLADLISIEIILSITGSLQLLILLWSWRKFPENL